MSKRQRQASKLKKSEVTKEEHLDPEKIRNKIEILDELLRNLDEESAAGHTYADKTGKAIQYGLADERDALKKKLKKLEKGHLF